MTLYPLGIQSFPDLIRDGYVYVDKTALIYQLTHTFRGCFLSRPRRFGKSLLQSTIEAYFQGEKDLFKGLAIENLETEWPQHPVIHIDLNNGTYTSKEELTESLIEVLEDLEDTYQVSNPKKTLGGRFNDVIKKAYASANKQRVVILIDEYDKPLLEVIQDEEAQNEYRKVLKPFYGTLKKAERYIRFIFITGVTKFAKLSVFSDLNQLKDVSLLPEYATICGITTQEMLSNFYSGIEEFAAKKSYSIEKMVTELERKYDGYHFSKTKEGVFNPFSLLNALNDKEMSDYWFQTGTPNFLVEALQEHHWDLSTLSGYKADADLLTSIESMHSNPIPVIYQSGYLSIKRYEEKSETYILDFPNEEVERGFLRYLLPRYTDIGNSTSKDEIDKFVEEVRRGEPVRFLLHLQALLGGWNYDLILDREAHYQNVLFVIFSLMKFQVKAEPRISNGRIDLVVETDKFVYIMEFKYKGTAQEAIDQIHNKGYAIPYQCDERTIYLMGINFDSSTRNIDPNWIIEEFQKP
ncbi:MAG: ATP-binding protein [Bacteroidales bacterium]|nr:ATP-binding protein [Bacteroidales bacterium]